MKSTDLRDILTAAGVSSDTYSLSGGLPNEVFCIGQSGIKWEVYYSERGVKTGLMIFDSEEDACAFFLEMIIPRANELNIRWIECDGGPHIFIERGLITEWSGSDHDRLYGLTEDIDDYAGLISVGNKRILVLCEDIPRSGWIPAIGENSGYLVVWNYCEIGTTDSDVVRAVLGSDESLFKSTDMEITFSENSVFLMPACSHYPGEIYPYAEINIDPGTYTIGIISDYESGGCGLRIFRLRKILTG